MHCRTNLPRVTKELNLLYRFDDTDQDSETDLTIEQRIEQILLKCREYLPIDLVGVIVPGDGYEYYSSSDALKPKNAEQIFRQIRRSSFFRSQSGVESLVNNADGDKSLSSTLSLMPYKSILAPLFITSNEVAGALVFINRIYQDDFSNSDRKIAEVIASDISRILRENRDYLTGLYNRTAFESRMSFFN